MTFFSIGGLAIYLLRVRDGGGVSVSVCFYLSLFGSGSIIIFYSRYKIFTSQETLMLYT